MTMPNIFLAVGERGDRFALYHRLRPDLIVFGDKTVARFYEEKAPYWSSELAISEKAALWLTVLKNQIPRPLLSSRTGLFLPFRHLTTVIIDDPNHPGHRDDQVPKYRSVDVAKQLSRLGGCKVVLGMPVLTVSEAYEFSKHRVQTLDVPRWQMPEIRVQTPSVEPIVPQGSTLYFLPRKGTYAGSVCADCGTLQPYPPAEHCSQCRSARLKPYGIGTSALAEKVGGLIVDQEHPFKTKNWQPRRKVGAPTETSELKTMVATHKIFDYDVQFDTTVVSHFDHLLSLPDPFIAEHMFETLTKLAQLTTKQLIIQTRQGDHPAIKYLQTPKAFYDHELGLRRQNNLPPFARLVRLISAKKLPVPKLPTALTVSPIHQTASGEYQILATLPKDAPLAPLLPHIGRFRLDPDPDSLL